ncbi:MAG: hypothetical protein JWM93_693 [Frankiales bacterium]|nr:hypothetical protein [Frankiales bacterium]
MTVRSVPEPVDDLRLHKLSLHELREYRRRLGIEEQRVSYWRRLVQARLDLAAAGRSGQPLGPKQIVAALGESYRPGGHNAFTPIESYDDLPPLPDLATLWATPLVPHGSDADSGTIAALAEAEMMLSTYRNALHRRLDTATGELIRRYKVNPALCLEVLPLDPPSAERAAV